MTDTHYSIEISLYSDELYPDDYVDGQVNSYYMNKEQYEKFIQLKFEYTDDIHEWCINNLNDSDIYLAEEFINGIASLDQFGFDFHTQKKLLVGSNNSVTS